VIFEQLKSVSDFTTITILQLLKVIQNGG